MNRWRKFFSTVLIAALAVGGGYFGSELMRDRDFARAQAQVDSARSRLSKPGDLQSAFRDVGVLVSPSVVNISVRKQVSVPHHGKMDPEQLRKFFRELPEGTPIPPGLENPGENPGEDSLEQMGTGSGVIMEVANGKAWILTNNHVAGGAKEMLVTLDDGREITDGVLVGADAKTDLAVVRINTDRVTPAQWGNSDELQKGDFVMAFGSPFGYVGSMTHGIVSALHRQAGILGSQGYENFIQVDAPINPGNSGGPLTDLKGNVVGINTAIASRSGGFQGIGFAIPSSQARAIYNVLKDKGKVVRGWLGIGISDVVREHEQAKSLGFKGESGIIVNEVFNKSPATTKLQAGDIIVKINDSPVKDVQQLRNMIALTAPGSEVKMNVFRAEKYIDVSIKLGEQPESMAELAARDSTKPEEPQELNAKSLGIAVADVSDDTISRFSLGEIKKGAVITTVDPTSLAAQTGLRTGDVITNLGDTKVDNANEFLAALKHADVQKGIRLNIQSREGTRMVFVRSQTGLDDLR